jgi:hypothetical protein
MDSAETSLLLLENLRGFACYLGLASTPVRSLASLASIVSLNFARVSLDEGWHGSCSTVPSQRKCTFLCPRAKPCSIFLPSFWVPHTVKAPKVAGSLRQRYVECKAASNVFSRPRPNMAL